MVQTPPPLLSSDPSPFPQFNMTDTEDHYLDSFLSQKLPELGLDAETYAPYVTGNDGDDDDDLNELIELLRASSESHGDDDDAWKEFRDEISRRRKDYLLGEDARKVGFDYRFWSLLTLHVSVFDTLCFSDFWWSFFLILFLFWLQI